MKRRYHGYLSYRQRTPFSRCTAGTIFSWTSNRFASASGSNRDCSVYSHSAILYEAWVSYYYCAVSTDDSRRDYCGARLFISSGAKEKWHELPQEYCQLSRPCSLVDEYCISPPDSHLGNFGDRSCFTDGESTFESGLRVAA